MTIQEAHRILGTTSKDSLENIKRRYRENMKRHHPDVASADPEKAKEINAAYELIFREILQEREVSFAEGGAKKARTAARDSRQQEAHTGQQNPEQDRLQKWNPWEEEFTDFLKRCNQIAKELLEDAEEEVFFYAESDRLQLIRFPYQAKLFDFLVQSRIPPIETLRNLIPYETDQEGRSLYTLQAVVGGDNQRSIRALKEEEYLIPVRIADRRLFVADIRGNILGHISFEDDAMYYTVIPILEAHACQIKMTVIRVSESAKKRRRTGTGQTFALVELILRQNSDVREVSYQREKEIQNLLKEYKQVLRVVQ